MKTVIVGVLLVVLMGIATAQDVSLSDELKKQSMSLTLVEGTLQGPGTEFLVREGAASRFVFVGEDHGLADVPQFCAAYFGELKKSGFDHLAVEVGPESAKLLERMAGHNGIEAIQSFDHKYFFSLPFYGWREEAEMLSSLVSNGMNLWGLDQEFILSPSFHFQRLLELAPDENARKVAAEYLEKSNAADKQMVAEKNPSVVFMASATKEDFQKLSGAFGEKNPEAARIIRELEVSWEIYSKNFQGRGMDSNLQRAGLMKKYFHEYYDHSKTAKVLFKFGAYHAMRGRSLIGVHDIGNHVSELAEGLGEHSFHVLVVVVKGTVNAWRPFSADSADKQKPYDVLKELDTADMHPFVAAASDMDWSVIDLRPIRKNISKYGSLDRGLEQILWGYDAVVLIPQGHAATLLNND